MSMSSITTHERMRRMYAHQEADRIPVTDQTWPSTLERWHKEGLPQNVNWADYLGLDQFASIGVDNSPQYPVKIIEETEEYVVKTTNWGATLKNWKHHGGVPEFLNFTVTDPETWQKARERMSPTRDRINWDDLKANYTQWRKEGRWIVAHFWFGFDVTHSWMVGTERILTAMALQPEWVSDMFNHLLDVDLALFEMIWEAGYRFDEIRWPDDMGYKGKTFFSVDMYRELLKPVHKRAADWAHAKGVKVRLHSCGNILPLIPELLDIGIDMLNPIEVKAGMEPTLLKQQYGDRLAFQGGLNTVLFDHPGQLWAEMRRVIPVMKKHGGYLCSSDHSVPDSVSLETFREFVNQAKLLGCYT